MKTKTIVQVYVCDGSALYVDGILVSEWFTGGQSRLLEALGHTWTSLHASEEYYKCEKWPALLAEVHEEISK